MAIQRLAQNPSSPLGGEGSEEPARDTRADEAELQFSTSCGPSGVLHKLAKGAYGYGSVHVVPSELHAGASMSQAGCRRSSLYG
eukprot:4322572-Amphidinium_carterae.1